jgi:sulfate adenylyltransferase (ADP) / ATP adenylyltransferase
MCLCACVSPDKPFSLTSLPYANHVIRFSPTLPSSPPSELSHEITQSFLSLLDLAVSTIRHDPLYPAGAPSYNVIITIEHMHLIPRRLDSPPLEAKEVNEGLHTEEASPPLSVNSLAFAGMLVAKSESELEAVKNAGVGKILRSVALESVHELQVTGSGSVGAMDNVES